MVSLAMTYACVLFMLSPKSMFKSGCEDASDLHAKAYYPLLYKVFKYLGGISYVATMVLLTVGTGAFTHFLIQTLINLIIELL